MAAFKQGSKAALPTKARGGEGRNKKSSQLTVNKSNSRLNMRQKRKMASLMSVCSDDVTKLELPFQDQASFCTVGNTLIHLVKCSTEWGNKHTSNDNCDVCKAERKAIIDEIKQKISDRLNSHLKAANQNEQKLGDSDETKLEQDPVTVMVDPVTPPIHDTTEVQQPKTKDVTFTGAKSSTLQPHISGMKSKAGLYQGGNSRAKGGRYTPSVTNINKHKSTLLAARKSQLSAKSSMASVSSQDSLNGKLISYTEWDKIKEQTLEALYEANPDIDKLYGMYVQIRKVRMNSPEMSNTCNESQALLDNTVSQLYQTMTDPCRENMQLNKVQDTEMSVLTSLIQATQTLKQQLQLFNIFDRDGVIKRAEAKIKDRIKKTIAVAAKSKNRDQLTELIIIMKNNTFLKSHDLLDTARRQVQGLTYDDFITKHSNRLKQQGPVTKKTAGVKEENQLKSKLTKLVQEIEAVQEENGEDGVNVELNSQLFIRLIELLEKYLKKLGDAESVEYSGGLELYYKIIRGAIRRTVQAQDSGEDVTKLRKVLQTRGRTLPLRVKTLELCQLVDRFRVTKTLLENSQNRDQNATKSHVQTIHEVTKSLHTLLKDPKLSKIAPERLRETLQNQSNQLLQRDRLETTGSESTIE